MSSADSSEWIRATLADHEKPLIAYARSFVGSLEPARDLVQETFIALCRTPQSEVEAKVKAWLYAVCRNRCLDFLRKEKRLNPLSPEIIEQQPTSDLSPDSSLEAREKEASLMRMLQTLPSNQGEVLRLKFLHEMSYSEISAVTQLSETNVGFLIHTGLKTLRRQWMGREIA